MKIAKKLTLIGCTLLLGYTLLKWWAAPRYVEIDMQFSEPLPDGDYNVVGNTDDFDRIKIKHGKIYIIK